MFGDEADMYKIEDVQIQDLGKVGEITITKDDCLLMKVKTFLFNYFCHICYLPVGNFVCYCTFCVSVSDALVNFEVSLSFIF